MSKLVSCISPLSFPLKTLDPFLFCVYHKDAYPAGDALMQAPRRGNGADFDNKAPYRMYHGERIPGFPQHPHRGFETVTATIQGIVDHTDSLGNAGRYGQGDLQWMTAGKGIVHGEMFPLINQNSGNDCRFFQIWLNLPARLKMVDPTYVMHWHESIPVITSPDGKTHVTLWAGQLEEQSALKPPPNSWASQPDSDVAIFLLHIAPGGSYILPPALGGANINRTAYFVEGKALKVGSELLATPAAVTLDAAQPAPFNNTHSSESADILILQGRPIGEPVAQQGPFVMNTQQEIQQAFLDYRSTRFDGWPWSEDAVVFPRDKGRFSKQGDIEEDPSLLKRS